MKKFIIFIIGFFLIFSIAQATFYVAKPSNKKMYVSQPASSKMYVNMSPVNLLTSGLILYQTFDGKYVNWTGTNASTTDISGSGNHGSTVLLTQNYVRAGKLGQAFFFDGGSGSRGVIIPNTGSISTLGSSTAVAACFWAKQTAAVINRTLFSKSNTGTDNSFELRVGNSGTQIAMHIATSTADPPGNNFGITPVSSWSAGVWHHVCTSYDGTQSGNAARLQIYIDGVNQVLAFTGTITFQLASSTQPLGIGKSGANGLTWNGIIDDFRLYNRPLTQAEVSMLYTQTK